MIELTSTTVRSPVRAQVPPYSRYSERAAGVGDLLGVIKPRRLAIIDPLERHARHVGAQDLLRQADTLRARSVEVVAHARSSELVLQRPDS